MMSGCARIGEMINNDTTKKPDMTNETTKGSKPVSCSNDQGDSVLLESDDDTLTKMTHVFTMSLEEIGVAEGTSTEEIQEKVNTTLLEQYVPIQGVDASSEISEDKVVITISIDFTQANMDDLVANGLIDEGEKDNQYVSLSKTQKDYSKSGYVCEIE